MREDVTNPVKVAILTNFDSYSEAYSLTRIVSEQIKMLTTHGYEIVVIVQDSFEPQKAFSLPGVTLKRIPNVACHNEVKKDETFDEDVTAIKTALDSALSDIDVVLTHDIIYQNAALKHNFASRQIAEKYPKIKWLHWIHSATSPVTLDALRNIFSDQYLDLVKKPFPNSLYVFFNHYSVPRIAKDFNVSEEVVRVVHHPSDISEVLALTPAVSKLVKDKNILDADAICIYPIRLDRGKQVEYVIKTIAMIKEFGLKIRIIVVDFHSTGGDKVTYRDELKNLGIDWGLNAEELIFTSQYNEDWNVEVPHEDVMAMMRLGNVFIMPSVSESYSLITQEAGMNKCVVVLNQDFPPFRDIFGQNAIFRKYSSSVDIFPDPAEMGTGRTNTSYGPNNASDQERKTYEMRYHKQTAGMIVAKLQGYQDLALATFLRKTRNLDYIFEHELQPLLFEEIK